MSRTYKHPLTQSRSSRRPEVRTCYSVEPADVLICEERSCTRPGILVLMPGIDASCAPCYCLAHMPR